MKKSFKLFITVILAISLLCVISGCGETNDPTPSAEPDNTPEATDTPEATNTPAPTKEVPEVRPDSKEPPVFEVPEVGENGFINLFPLMNSTAARVIDIVVVNDAEKAFSLFDDSAERLMRIPNVTAAEAIFRASAPIRVDYFSLVSADNASELPVKFTLYGSKDNTFSDSKALYSADSLVIPTENFTESELFKTENTDYYQFYKLSVESVNGGSGIALGEMIFYADPAISESCIGEFPEFNNDISNYTVLNAHLKPKMTMMVPEHEGGVPKLVFDNDIETFNYMTLQWGKEYDYISYIFITDAELTIDAYRFTMSPNPGSGGAPKSWKLCGTNDKKMEEENLVLLDERTNEAMPMWPYGESDVYTIQNPGSYKYYVIYFTESAMVGNDENWTTIDISEMTLLEKK